MKPINIRGTMPPRISCPNCNATEINRQHIPLPRGAYHIKAKCAACGRFIKFLPHEPIAFHFGRYRGKTVAEVASKDRGYLKWCLSENVVKGRLKDAIKGAVTTA